MSSDIITEELKKVYVDLRSSFVYDMYDNLKKPQEVHGIAYASSLPDRYMPHCIWDNLTSIDIDPTSQSVAKIHLPINVKKIRIKYNASHSTEQIENFGGGIVVETLVAIVFHDKVHTVTIDMSAAWWKFVSSHLEAEGFKLFSKKYFKYRFVRANVPVK